MNIVRTALSCLLLAAASPTFADPVLLTFDSEASAHPDVSIDASTLTYVDGITFSPSTAAYITASAKAFSNGLGNFYGSVGNSADQTSNKGALALTADSFVVSVPGGFNGPFSIDFAGQGSAHLVALDQLGNVLATFSPAPAGSNNGCAAGFACNWTTLSFDLGSALNVYGVEVSGANGLQWFDNVNFANVNQPTGVPEPNSLALSLMALGVLAWTRSCIGGKQRRTNVKAPLRADRLAPVVIS
jgi:hypothetical protein